MAKMGQGPAVGKMVETSQGKAIIQESKEPKCVKDWVQGKWPKWVQGQLLGMAKTGQGPGIGKLDKTRQGPSVGKVPKTSH